MTRLPLFILLITILSIPVCAQYTHPPYRQFTLRDGLSQMQVISLFQDSRGYIWAGTKKGVNCFNGERMINLENKSEIAKSHILQISEDYKGCIWVSSLKGFSCYDGESWKSYPPLNYATGNLAPTPDGKIWFLYRDQQMKSQFGYLENGEFHDELSMLPHIDKSLNFGIAYSDQSNVLVLSDKNNVYEIRNNKPNKIFSSTKPLSMGKVGSSILIYEIDLNAKVNVFEYTNGKLTCIATIIDNQLTQKSFPTHNITFQTPISTHFIYTLTTDTAIVREFPSIWTDSSLTDRDGYLWIGGEDGLYSISPGGFETYRREVLPSVWSTVEDLKGNIWFASYENGLKKFDGKSIRAFSLRETGGLGKRFFFHPSADQRGKLYFPGENGVLTYDGQYFGHIDGLNCMTTFYDRERDQLWVGSLKAVSIYDKNQKLVRTIVPDIGIELKGYILTIIKDKNGYYWLGSGSGLWRYNYDTKKTISYTRDNGRLPADGVISAFNTPDGLTWFGSSNGLLYYDNNTDSIRKINRDEISGTVSLVSAIDTTWLVFSQSTGIYLMDLKKFKHDGEVELHLFNQYNGYMGIDPGQDGAMVDSHGNIWLTSSSEIVKLNPRELKISHHCMNVRIWASDGKKLPYGTTQITLPRNNQSTLLQFDAICFNRPKPVLYSWKVEHDSTKWSSWQEDPYAVLSNLPDGVSRFLVRAKIPGVPGAIAETSIQVVVSLAIWKQAWFFPTLLVFFSLLAILAVILLLQTRTQMTEINKQAKTFQLQAILSQMNPHFIFNVMAALQSMILSANIEKANDYLVRMSVLVRRFLEASLSTSSSKAKKSGNGELALANELEILRSFIEFQQLIYPDKFDFCLSLDSNIDTGKTTIPPMLIQPFVENAIRHGLLQKAEKGLLKLKISAEKNGHLLIVISDDGIGIKKAGEIIGKSPLLYTSRGKELTEKRIKLLNEMGYHIDYYTESSDKGTTVTLNLKKHDS
jgi:ligand-binding sensor domain-containing protein/two-component sensor histidine kinase